MRTKLLFAICMLALVSCNNEPEISLYEDALPSIESAILNKTIDEANDYLVSKGLERTGYDSCFCITKMDENKNIYNDSNYVKYDYRSFTHKLTCLVNRSDSRLYYIEGKQDFLSDTIALQSSKSWLKYMDKKKTSDTYWIADIIIYTPHFFQAIYRLYPTSDTWDSGGRIWHVGDYDEFKKTVTELSLDQIFSINAEQKVPSEQDKWISMITKYYHYPNEMGNLHSIIFISSCGEMMNTVFNFYDY